MPSAACASDRSGCLHGCTVAGSSEVVGNEVGERLPGGETPADAERVPSRVGVHLVTLIAVQILSFNTMLRTNSTTPMLRASIDDARSSAGRGVRTDDANTTRQDGGSARWCGDRRAGRGSGRRAAGRRRRGRW